VVYCYYNVVVIFSFFCVVSLRLCYVLCNCSILFTTCHRLCVVLFCIFITCYIVSICIWHVFSKLVTYLLGISQLSGMIYKNDILRMQSWLRVPRPVSTLAGHSLGRLLRTPCPTDLQAPMGATLELQRLQHVERLEQQLMWAQLARQATPPPAQVRSAYMFCFSTILILAIKYLLFCFVLHILHVICMLSPPVERSELEEIMRLIDLSVCLSVCVHEFAEICTLTSAL